MQTVRLKVTQAQSRKFFTPLAEGRAKRSNSDLKNKELCFSPINFRSVKREKSPQSEIRLDIHSLPIVSQKQSIQVAASLPGQNRSQAEPIGSVINSIVTSGQRRFEGIQMGVAGRSLAKLCEQGKV